MELPLYHMPTLRGVSIRTWERLKAFVFKAGKFIVGVAVVLTVLNSLGRDGTFGNENTSNSVLASVGQTMMPVFTPMGVREDNWPAAVGLITGLFAKEVVVGTLDALYSQMAHAEGGNAGPPISIAEGVMSAFASIPVNLIGLADRILDPLGIDVAVSDANTLNTESASAMGVMASHFDGKLGAFAYLLAILLYSPCMSALSAYYRELSPGWMVFVALYSTALGYCLAVLTYQVGNFARHPGQSIMWVGVIASVFAIGAVSLALAGRRTPPPVPQAAE